MARLQEVGGTTAKGRCHLRDQDDSVRDTIYIYTTTGFGPRKKQKMLGAYHFLCICKLPQNTTASILIPPRGRATPLWWCIHKLLYFGAVCIYIKTESTPAIFLFFLGPNPVVVYIYDVPKCRSIAAQIFFIFRIQLHWGLPNSVQALNAQKSVALSKFNFSESGLFGGQSLPGVFPTTPSPAIARAYFSKKMTGFQNMHLDKILTAKDATDAKTLANSTSPGPESNGRCPGPGFGQNSVKSN